MQHGPKIIKAAFLDRDGVINVDRGYVYRPEDLLWVPGFLSFLRQLLHLGYMPVVVTNQSGVARGNFTLKDVELFHNYIRQLLRKEGLDLEVFLVCPHHPQGSVPSFTKKCLCRKPGTQLVDNWLSSQGWEIDRERSFFLGDRHSDVLCGRALGITSLQLLGDLHPPSPAAHGVVKDFCEIWPYLEESS